MRKGLLVLIVFLSFVAFVFGCANDPTYFLLEIVCSDGGRVETVLEDGARKDGKFLSGSLVSIKTFADEGYVLSELWVGEDCVWATSTQIVITSDVSVSAVFKKGLKAKRVVERVQNALLNEFDLADFDTADGITGSGSHQLAFDDGEKLNLDTEFLFAKNTADSFVSLVLTTLNGDTVFEMHFIDSASKTGARLYFDFFGEEKYYVSLPSLAAFATLFGFDDGEFDNARALSETSEQFSSIDYLEMLGVVYNISNDGDEACLSVDVTELIAIASELIEPSQNEFADDFLAAIEALPQIDLALEMEFETISGEEFLKSLAFEARISGIADQTLDKLTIAGTTKSMALQLYSKTPQAPAYNPEGAQQTTINEITKKLTALALSLR